MTTDAPFTHRCKIFFHPDFQYIDSKIHNDDLERGIEPLKEKISKALDECWGINQHTAGSPVKRLTGVISHLSPKGRIVGSRKSVVMLNTFTLRTIERAAHELRISLDVFDSPTVLWERTSLGLASPGILNIEPSSIEDPDVRAFIEQVQSYRLKEKVGSATAGIMVEDGHTVGPTTIFKRDNGEIVHIASPDEDDAATKIQMLVRRRRVEARVRDRANVAAAPPGGGGARATAAAAAAGGGGVGGNGAAGDDEVPPARAKSWDEKIWTNAPWGFQTLTWFVLRPFAWVAGAVSWFASLVSRATANGS